MLSFCLFLTGLVYVIAKDSTDEYHHDSLTHGHHYMPLGMYQRMIVQTMDNNAPAALSELLDAHQQRMLAINAPNRIFDQDDVDDLKDAAFENYLSLFGLDFAAGVYNNVTDSYVAIGSTGPIAAMFPTFIGDCPRYRVAFDNYNTKKVEEDWCVINIGTLAQFLTNGTLTSGVNAGYKYAAGEIISFGYTLHAKKHSDLRFRRNFEQFTVHTPTPGLTLGGGGVHAPLRYLDSRGAIGFGADSVYTDIVNNAVVYRTRHVVTFFKGNKYPQA